jgi:branched-chain amino acid transport system ATP-binding protein
VLECRDVEKNFGGVRAVQGVSFAVAAGEIVGLIGANGAGKTTLLAMIAGNLRPSAGDIVFDGRSLVGLRPDQIANRGIARTFQIVRPFAHLSVLDNVATAAMFGARQNGSRRDAEAIGHDALATLGLSGRASDLAGNLTLSGQKRLELARAIATGARLVMLDEIMAGLTPPEVNEMLDVVRDLRDKRGLTLIVIEHVMRAVMQLSDRVVALHLGRVIARGTPVEIAANEEVAQVYFGRSG